MIEIWSALLLIGILLIAAGIFLQFSSRSDAELALREKELELQERELVLRERQARSS